jgi:DNA-3-methyladenine glycosylase
MQLINKGYLFCNKRHMLEQPFDISSLRRLPRSFYLRPDVVQVARELLGKIIVTKQEALFTAGRIVETEAYAGEMDKASHAYRGKTPRTAVMFGEGGVAYVYLCYGLHQMFNIVTNVAGIPHAILIRALEPLAGIDVMLQRTGKKMVDNTLTRGPGNVGKAMGFHTSQCGLSLAEDELFIADDDFEVMEADVAVTPRIGVDYAGDDAFLPYRFYLKRSPYVSGKKNKNQ